MSKFPSDWAEKVMAQNPDLAEANGWGQGAKAQAPVQPAVKDDSPLEQEFDELWAQLGGPPMKKELRFSPPRRWRFDRANEDIGVAIELEGGIWDNGRHTRGQGFIDDAIKYNTAIMLDWTVFRLATGMVTEEHVRPIVGFCKDRMRN